MKYWLISIIFNILSQKMYNFPTPKYRFVHSSLFILSHLIWNFYTWLGLWCRRSGIVQDIKIMEGMYVHSLWGCDSVSLIIESIHSMLEWIRDRFREVTHLESGDLVGETTKENHYTAGRDSVWQEDGGTNSFSPKKPSWFKTLKHDAQSLPHAAHTCLDR